MLLEELKQYSIYTAILYTENMSVIYIYQNFYGYSCLCIALVQTHLILQVQHIYNTLIGVNSFNSTVPLQKQY